MKKKCIKADCILLMIILKKSLSKILKKHNTNIEKTFEMYFARREILEKFIKKFP